MCVPKPVDHIDIVCYINPIGICGIFFCTITYNVIRTKGLNIFGRYKA